MRLAGPVLHVLTKALGLTAFTRRVGGTYLPNVLAIRIERDTTNRTMGETMTIQRIDVTSGPGPIMTRCIVRGDTVYLCGLVAGDTAQDIKGQTQQILDKIDHYLHEAGTTKSNLLTAQLWITDMANFADMNSVWNGWVDPQNPPVRACVRADLARPEILVEIMVTAAK